VVNEAEAAPSHDVRPQTEIHEVEDVEKLGAKLQSEKLGAAARSKPRVLDKCNIKAVQRWSAGFASFRRSKKLRASKAACAQTRTPTRGLALLPDLVVTFVNPAAPWPTSAGITPDLDATSWIASTL